MTLEHKINDVIVEHFAASSMECAEEIVQIANNHFANSTKTGTSSFEVPMKYLEDIRVTHYLSGEKTLYKLPFTWAGCDHIKTIFEEIGGKTRLVHVEFGRILITRDFEKMYDCDRFDYDDKECVLSFRPI